MIIALVDKRLTDKLIIDILSKQKKYLCQILFFNMMLEKLRKKKDLFKKMCHLKKRKIN